jgi:hypothetical protein
MQAGPLPLHSGYYFEHADLLSLLIALAVSAAAAATSRCRLKVSCKFIAANDEKTYSPFYAKTHSPFYSYS